jgi:hypothetical protein
MLAQIVDATSQMLYPLGYVSKLLVVGGHKPY